MADIHAKLVRAYNVPTLYEDRTVLLEAYQYLLNQEQQIPTVYDRFFNWITKPGVKDLRQPLLMTKWGLSPMYFPTLIEQGESFVPRRHIQAKMSYWTMFNPMETEIKFSRYGPDRSQFTTEQNLKIMMANEASQASNAWTKFKQMLVTLLFISEDDFKKQGSLNGDGEDGINKEIVEMMFPADGATKGYLSYMMDMSVEKTFFGYKDNKLVHPYGEDKADAKPYMVKVHKFKAIMDALRKCLACGMTECETSTLKGFNGSVLSPEYGKLIGLVHEVKRAVLEMTTTNTSKYNVGINYKDKTKCCKIAEVKKLETDYGANIGYCKKCDGSDEDICCCYNQNMADSTNLAAIMHPEDLLEIEKAFPLINHPAYFENISQYIGVSQIFLFPFENLRGKITIANRQTLGLYPIANEVIPAQYPEFRIENILFNYRWHLGKWPFQWHTFEKKKSS